MDNDETPINGRPARSRRLRDAAEDVSLAVEERLIWRGGDALRSILEVVRRPLEGLVWVVQRGLVWPLQDRAGMLSGPARALAAAAVLVLAVAAVAGGAALAGSGGSGEAAPANATAQVIEPPVEVTSAPAANSAPEPTLHGAAPVFKPTGKKGGTSELDAAESVASAPPQQAAASASGSAAAGKISSVPGGSPSAAKASTSAVEGRPAGPAAIAVAREFAGAFLLYETGGDKGEVRRAFAETATPELSRALLRRPPRQPANVEVPKAKVANVVAGPSRGGVYSVSVSLLRVGLTSELRLSMEKLKKAGWQVTNVLG